MIHQSPTHRAPQGRPDIAPIVRSAMPCRRAGSDRSRGPKPPFTAVSAGPSDLSPRFANSTPRCDVRGSFLSALRAARLSNAFSNFCRGPCAVSASIRAAFARPRARRQKSDVAVVSRSRDAIRGGRLPPSMHPRQAFDCSPVWSPRPHPNVQESTSRHEKRNAHQCLATGGMPDRDR